MVFMNPSAKSQGKGFNAPKNYLYSFHNKRDTLIIDYGSGKKIEFNYNWQQLFNPYKKKYINKSFWPKLKNRKKIVESKLGEIPLKEDTKYHIIYESKIKHRHFLFNYIKDLQAKNAELKNQGFSKRERDSILNAKISNRKIKTDEKPIENNFNQTSIKILERKSNSSHREYLIQNGQIVNKLEWQHIVEIKGINWSVKLYLSNFNQLPEFDFDELEQFLNKEKKTFLAKRYYQYFTKIHYKKEGSKFKHIATSEERIEQRPKFLKLGFDAGFGSSVVKSKLSADASAGINLYFNENLQYAAKIGVRLQSKSFGINNRIRNNVFIDALMDVNIGESFKKEQWVGAGFGYLVKREGEIYGKDTGRIFFKYGFHNGINIQPEFNYSFHDEKFLLGIGFSLNF